MKGWEPTNKNGIEMDVLKGQIHIRAVFIVDVLGLTPESLE